MWNWKSIVHVCISFPKHYAQFYPPRILAKEGLSPAPRNICFTTREISGAEMPARKALAPGQGALRPYAQRPSSLKAGLGE